MRRDRERASRRARRSVKDIIFALLRAAWHNKFKILLVSGCVCLAYCIRSYDLNQRVGQMRLVLNYKEAAQMLYPNGTKFEIKAIKSEEVLARAIQNGGLDDRATVSMLADHITIAPVRTRAVTNDENSYYVSMTYNITFQQVKELTGIDVDSLLALIGGAYKDIFYEKYSEKQNLLYFDLNDAIRSLEYDEISDVISMWANDMTRFLDRRSNEDSSYRASNGETFASLSGQVNDFINIELSKFNAFVHKSGLAKDKERFISKIEYNNRLLTRKYNDASDSYDIRLEIIEIYDSAITAAVLIPTYDLKDEFYMSRTKVGVDYMAERAAEAAVSMTGVLNKIEKNSLTINDMRAGANSAMDRLAAEKMLESMVKRLQSLAATVREMDNEYVRHKTNNYIVLSTSAKTLDSMVNIKMSALLFIGCSGVQVLFYAWLHKWRIGMPSVSMVFTQLNAWLRKRREARRR